MTITLELPPDQAAELRARAAQQQQAPETIAYDYVLAALDTPTPREITEEDHERLVQRMLEQGIISHVPARPGQVVPFQPITVQGRPLSEMIIEERREETR